MKGRTIKTLSPRKGKIHVSDGDTPGRFLVECDFTMTRWPKGSMRHIMDIKMMSAEKIMELTGVDVLLENEFLENKKYKMDKS